MDKMDTRNLKYEKAIKTYLFKGDSERHKAILRNIGLKPNKEE